MRFSEVQVSNASPNLDNAILVQTAFITIANINTVRTHAAGALKLLERFATIFRMILAKRLDFILMLMPQISCITYCTSSRIKYRAEIYKNCFNGIACRGVSPSTS